MLCDFIRKILHSSRCAPRGSLPHWTSYRGQYIALGQQVRTRFFFEIGFLKVTYSTEPADDTSPVPWDLVFLGGDALCSADAGSASLYLDFDNVDLPANSGPVHAFDYALQSDRIIVAKEDSLVLLGN